MPHMSNHREAFKYRKKQTHYLFSTDLHLINEIKIKYMGNHLQRAWTWVIMLETHVRPLYAAWLSYYMNCICSF